VSVNSDLSGQLNFQLFEGFKAERFLDVKNGLLMLICSSLMGIFPLNVTQMTEVFSC
jgi:hypothetical protein